MINDIKKRILSLIENVAINVYEKDVIFRLAFLAMLSGESIFVLGKPGIAKSLIARRIKFAIKDGKIFEYLMNRFSTQEEIFGPISVIELQKGNYIRKINNYLPTANIAFLDEIWKAGPSILNNLLTIINEKIYKNSNEDIKVPLWLLISASNELPEENKGLEALYDRFIIRYIAKPLVKKNNFDKMISSEAEINIKIDNNLQITKDEYYRWLQEFKKIDITDATLKFIDIFKKELKQKTEEKAYISDRRWTKIVKLMKASAYYNGRNQIDKVDWLIIPYCIWDDYEQEIEYTKIFNITFKNNLMLDIELKRREIIKQINKVLDSLKYIESGEYLLIKFFDVFNSTLIDVYYKINGFTHEYPICFISRKDYKILVSNPNRIIEINLYLGKTLDSLEETMTVRAKYKDLSRLIIYLSPSHKQKEMVFIEVNKKTNIDFIIVELKNKLVNLELEYKKTKIDYSNEIKRLKKSSCIFFEENLKILLKEYLEEEKLKKNIGSLN